MTTEPTDSTGDSPAATEVSPGADKSAGDGGLPTIEQLWATITEVEDPEIRMSIVELGLVYEVMIDDEGQVTIDLTLTTPACPVGPMIQGQIYHLLTQLDGVADVEVNLVWDPPWDPKTMASEEVKMMLGIW